ncbi:MAG: bifunctional precorrin-2 dehydrogenase/sirohydrochlorin ferrochelatase [Candidatus Pristimantibacillus sp.]
MNEYYPVMLQLQGEKITVVGGGAVAERKIKSLLDAGADNLFLISPQLTTRLQEWAKAGAFHYIERGYSAADIQDARLVFAATNDSELNKRIAEEARQAGAWVNVVDDSSFGNMVNPSVVRRGDLLIAVSASGASPALSIRIKQELEQQYGLEYTDSVKRLRELRELILVTIEDKREREALLRMAAAEVPLYEEGDKDIEAWLTRLRKLMTGGIHNGIIK